MTDAALAKQTAEAFWAQMARFSQRVFRSLDLNESGSPNGEMFWRRPGQRVSVPTGAALHWTAANSIASTLKWFCDPKSQVSAHMVVADRKLPWAEPLLEGLPLVAALPATAVMCRSVGETAWHVRNMDGSLYGIENVNVGALSGRGTTLGWSSGGKVLPYRSDKPSVSCFGQRFEPYTLAQLQTNVDILRYVNAQYGDTLKRAQVLGHSCWQGPNTNSPPEDKRDPGPHFPIEDIRHAVFAPGQQTLPAGVSDPDYALAWRAQIARQAMTAYRATEGRYNAAALADILQTGDGRIWTDFVTTCARPAAIQIYGVLADAMMACLGFACGPQSTDLERFNSVKLCQRLLGVAQDAVVGPKTAQALSLRFRQIFVLG